MNHSIIWFIKLNNAIAKYLDLVSSVKFKVALIFVACFIRF